MEQNGACDEHLIIAAKQDAIQEASKFGVQSGCSLSFSASADDGGMKDAMHSLSLNISCMKKSDSSEFEFSEEDREKQER